MPNIGSVTTSNIFVVKKIPAIALASSPIVIAYSGIRRMYFDCRNAAKGMAGNANPVIERLLVLNKVIWFPVIGQ
jgi:hypothetical protein